MRNAIRYLLVLVPVIALAIFGALKGLEKLERGWLLSDLSSHSRLVAGNMRVALATGPVEQRNAAVTDLLNELSRDQRFVGALLCSRTGRVLAKSDTLPNNSHCLPSLKSEVDLQKVVIPLVTADGTRSNLILFNDAAYLQRRYEMASRYLVVLLAGLSLSFFLITLGVFHWTTNSSMQTLKSVLKALVTGELTKADRAVMQSELKPIAPDLSKVIKEFQLAKEAMKDSETGLAWTPTRLRMEIQKQFGDSQLCIISNREPYVHVKKGGKIVATHPASGLVTGIEPIVRACSGLWIAHGSGNGDRQTADATGKLLVPPGNPEYVLRRVWMSKEEEQGYYYGFSNEGLWPLCHIAHTRPRFEVADWKKYRLVNERFARSFIEEQGQTERPIVLIQDYHFALLPQLIREKSPEAMLSLFWHIPWPNPEVIGICPWKKELLTGMLGADLIGFHTQSHCNNFLDTVDRFLEARVDRERFTVTIRNHTCTVKPFSISVAWPPHSELDLSLEQFAAERTELRRRHGLPDDVKIGVGVDRVDYTKGIIERLKSVERLLELHPELVGKFQFIQIGAPSRTLIKRYQDLNTEVQELAEQINWNFRQARVPPILLKLSHHEPAELFRYYRAADLCFVSSLHDGMNLVAKEFVSARRDVDGVLVLSTFTGASRELNDALLVNPYDFEECASALYRALTMPQAERAQRMERMRAQVSDRNVYAWAGELLRETYRISQLKSGVTPLTEQRWASSISH